jgi:hypothetical protein
MNQFFHAEYWFGLHQNQKAFALQLPVHGKLLVKGQMREREKRTSCFVIY